MNKRSNLYFVVMFCIFVLCTTIGVSADNIDNINIVVKYGISENGPWRDTETEVLNDISEEETLDRIYIYAYVNQDDTVNMKIRQDDIDLVNGVGSVIFDFADNSSTITIIAEGEDEKESIVCISKIGESGIKSEEKIIIDLKYGASENGPWHDIESDILNDVPEDEVVDKVYIKAEAKTSVGRITNISIKKGDQEIRKTTAGIMIQEFLDNTPITIVVKSSKGVINSLTGDISMIGSVSPKEDITILVEYGRTNEGPWYQEEVQMLDKEGFGKNEYIKISASSNKTNINSIEIKSNDQDIASIKSDNMVYGFSKNMGEISVVAISDSGKMSAKDISVSGIEENERQITLTVKYGITENGPWRNDEEDILKDVKDNIMISEVYVKAYANVDVGSVVNMQINEGDQELKSEESNIIIYRFTNNTSGNLISIIARDNMNNIKVWRGDITKISAFGIKDNLEDGNDSLIQDVTEDFASLNWDIRKNIDWEYGLASEINLKLKEQHYNVPEIVVSRVGNNMAMVSIRTSHDGEEGYDIRYRLANKEDDKSFSEANFGSWQIYNGPFSVSSNMYVEAEGRYNLANPSYRSEIAVINIDEMGNEMGILEKHKLPLTSNKQYLTAYHEDNIVSNKYYVENDTKTTSSANGMFVIGVDKGTNETIKLREVESSITQDSIPYVVDNAVKISVTKQSDNVYVVKLTPGEKIIEPKVKEVGIIGEYELNGVVSGSVRKTNSIIGKNGVFTFEFKNVPDNMTCRAYYINEENEMIIG